MPFLPFGWRSIRKYLVYADTFTGYSVKHATTSKAYSKGVSIERIKKAAGWTEKSKTFAKYYKKPKTFSTPVIKTY